MSKARRQTFFGPVGSFKYEGGEDTAPHRAPATRGYLQGDALI
jgi:hypothetical protein